MKKKLGGKFWAAMLIFGLIGQIAWIVENMYLNVFLYKMFHASAADISLMVGASSVAATLTTILVGALSDKIGKRKLLMCLGYIIWGVSILGFAFIKVETLTPIAGSVTAAAALGVNLVIALDCVMTFFGSAANDAAYNAWLTDKGDEGDRGKIEGFNSMMPLVAILFVFGGFMGFNLDLTESWTMIFYIIGGVVLAIGILGFFIIEERENLEKMTLELGIHDNVKFVGRQADVKKWLDENTIFVYPSICGEGFGIAVAEAMARGCIPVTFRKGGLPELIENEENGYLIDEVSEEELANKILEILSLQNEEIDRLRKNAMQTARKFTIYNTIKELEKQYKNLKIG